MDNIKSIAALVPAGQKSLDLRLLIAAGKWRTLAQVGGSALSAANHVDSGKVRFILKRRDQQRLVITTHHEQSQEEMRLLALGQHDQATKGSTIAVRGVDNQIESDWELRGLGVDDVRSVLLQARAYEEVMLWDISLRPGVRTHPHILGSSSLLRNAWQGFLA